MNENIFHLLELCTGRIISLLHIAHRTTNFAGCVSEFVCEFVYFCLEHAQGLNKYISEFALH